jgi:hypothetical protein
VARITRQVRDGLVVGLIAYASVALFYAAFDLLASRGALFTVNVLGRAMFRGLRDPSLLGMPMAIDAVAVALYNGAHLVISLGIGMVVTIFVDHAEREPMSAQVMLLWILAGFVVTIGVVGVLTIPIRAVLPWWSIIVANALAVCLAGLYLSGQHPEFLSRATERPD